MWRPSERDARVATAVKSLVPTSTMARSGHSSPYQNPSAIISLATTGLALAAACIGDLNYTADTCRQCKEPQCMNVCPIGAITWRPKEGCCTVDHKRCIGCSACTTACPWMMATVNTESKKSSKCVLCGECANACPTGALKIIEWKDITV